MKNLILKSLFYTFLATSFVSCVNDDDYNVPALGCTETTLVKTKEVSQIPASATIAQYTDDEVIEAYVTTSDEEGNFFKSISFQTLDGSRAFSVPVDVTSTFINFEPGRKVMIKMQNLYTDIKDGGMRIGDIYLDPSDGSVEVGRMSNALYLSALERSCTVVNEDDLVIETTLSELQNDAFLNKLVEIDNVQFSDAAITTTYYDETNDLGGATNHLLEDASGNTMIFRTSSYAKFAGKPVATGNGKVRGVLTKYGDDYQFSARYERDIILEGSRTQSIYTEDFQTSTNNTNLNTAGWTNFAEAGTWLWREKIFSGNGYAEFSAFGGQALNKAWLISPALDFTGYTNKSVQFKIAQHHLDVDSPNNGLEVLVSTNFDGTNVLAATWVAVPANIPTTSTAWYAFLGSNVDLSSYSGTIHVAFKFTGSGTNTTLDGAFQVDDFKAFGQ
ncbi:DUF5689 domain-containing protein [Flavobacterium sp.]|uniref:DUF5689 domain-containing protein n=1 Tax=Flavobacterium sp. TaxID=239 RepID=UPI0011DA9FD2|nr:MAG: DUF5017 domain-containing protein [Flavobacterium sp.]